MKFLDVPPLISNLCRLLVDSELTDEEKQRLFDSVSDLVFVYKCRDAERFAQKELDKLT